MLLLQRLFQIVFVPLLLLIATPEIGYGGSGRPEKKCHLQGQALDSLGNAIANATIRATSLSSPGIIFSVATDSDGYYRFTNPPSGEYSLSGFKAGCSFYSEVVTGFAAPENVFGSCGISNNLLNLFARCDGQATAQYEITGRVVKKDGASGAPRVSVRATPITGAKSKLLATTDENGNYKIRVPPGEYTVTPQLAMQQLSPTNRVVTVSTSSVSGVDFALTAYLQYRTIRGTVRQAPCEGDVMDYYRSTCQTNVGVPFADVFVTAGPGMSSVTENDGTFSLVVPEGPVEISAVYGGVNFAPRSRTILLTGADQTEVNFQAERNPSGFTISGLLRTSVGVPPVGTEVQAYSLSTRHTWGAPIQIGSGKTDSTGGYTITGLPLGEYEVRLAEGYSFTAAPEFRQLSIHGGDISTVDFTTYSPGELRYPIIGKVTFADGVPAPSVIVSIVSGKSSISFQSDGSGFYSTRTLLAGTYPLSASRTGYAITRRCSPEPCATEGTTLSGSEPTIQNFEATCAPNYVRSYDQCVLAPKYQLKGSVQTANGIPISGIRVQLGSRSTLTLADGTYQFSDVNNGLNIVTPTLLTDQLSSPLNYTVSLDGAGESGLDFFVSGPGATLFSVSGSVTFADNTPIENAVVSGIGLGSKTAAGGLFSFERIPNGAYTLSVAKEGMVVVSSNTQTTTELITVKDGDLANVRFVAHCANGFLRSGSECIPFVGSISGRVRFSDGVGVSDVNISRGPSSVRSDSNGAYLFSGLSNGSYTLSAEKSGYVFDPVFSNPVIIDNADRDTRDFTVTCGVNFMRSGAQCVPFEGALRGVVRFADGVPVSGAAISRGGSGGTTNSTGNFSLTGVPNGTHTLSATKEGMVISPSFSNPVTLLNADVSSLLFVAQCALGYVRSGGECVPFTGTLSGLVLFADGSGVSGAFLSRGEDTVTTDSTGVFTFTSIPNGSYTVSAQKLGFKLTPQFTNPVVVNNASQTNLRILAECSTGYIRSGAQCVPFLGIVSGAVRFSDGTPIVGATLTSADKSTVTDSNGGYAFGGLANGGYTVTATKSGFLFTPQFTSPVILSGVNVVNRDFIGECAPGFKRSGGDCHLPNGSSGGTIAGTVLFSDDTPLVGAVVSRIGETVISGSKGEFLFENLPDGIYQLSAAKTGVVISPSFQNPVTLQSSNAVGLRFRAECKQGYTRLAGDCAPLPKDDSIVLAASDGTFFDGVLLEWTSLKNGLTYLIYRSERNGEIGELLRSGLTTPRFTDTTPESGKEYFYTIIGVRSGDTPVQSNQDMGSRVTANDARLRSPVFAKYNTYLDQFNFLELIAAGSGGVKAKITVFNMNGQAGNTNSVEIPPGAQIDVDIHSLVGVKDVYGLVRIDFNESDPGVTLLGRMSNYRLNPGGRDFSFAFARELRNATVGATYALANSINPQGGKTAVANWAEVMNVTDNTVSFTKNIYNQGGEKVGSSRFTIPPLGEQDESCGHDLGQGVFLCEFLPDNASAPYLATVSRYSTDTSPRAKPGSFNFAFASPGRKGGEGTLAAPIGNRREKCWQEQNWVEVANVLETASDITLSFRDHLGAIVQTATVTVPSKSQFHFNASAHLKKGGVGSVIVESSRRGAIVGQSMFYYNDCKSNRLQTAYASELRSGSITTQMGTFNTNLGMTNELRVTNVAPETLSLDLHLFSLAFQSPTLSAFQVSPRGLQRALLNSAPYSLKINSYGTATLRSKNQSFVGEILRIREDGSGGLDYIMSTPLH